MSVFIVLGNMIVLFIYFLKTTQSGFAMTDTGWMVVLINVLSVIINNKFLVKDARDLREIFFSKEKKEIK